MIRHRWDITAAEAIALQRELAPRVRIESVSGPVLTIAGTDCAFTDNGWF